LITELPAREIPGHESSGLGNDEHPMRVVTRQVAGLASGEWTPELRDRVSGIFDMLADEWVMRSSPERAQVVADALERCGDLHGVALEVGAGNGAYTAMIAEHVDAVAAIELSPEMLARMPAEPGLRMRADASQLPFADGAADAVVLINMFLFPNEVERVLAPDGVVVWVNSSGDQTPIHLPPSEVAAALPGEWDGVMARAGVGLWCALRRAG
jgi:SAM-dependent methyltransferase